MEPQKIQRKHTKDLNSKKPLEISFINNNLFYNLLQRGAYTQAKNSFIIYDLSEN